MEYKIKEKKKQVLNGYDNDDEYKNVMGVKQDVKKKTRRVITGAGQISKIIIVVMELMS